MSRYSITLRGSYLSCVSTNSKTAPTLHKTSNFKRPNGHFSEL